jgi:hypothetical protein
VSSTQDSGFLSRWSRRKVQARQGVTLDEPVAAPPETPAAAPAPAPVPPTVATAVAPEPASDAVMAPSDAQSKPVPPTLADVAALTRESDFSRFVAPGVAGDVKNAALKKLFDDYTKPDPLPLASIRKMAQAAFLGLVEATPPPAPEAAQTSPAPAPMSAEVDAAERGPATAEPDEDADLRLQPHDAAGCGGAEDGAAADERRQS